MRRHIWDVIGLGRSVVSVLIAGLFLLLLFPISCKEGIVTPEELPVIWVNMSSLSMSATAIGPNPTNRVLTIKNTGYETLSYFISDDASFYDADWLTILPGNGSSSGQEIHHNIQINKEGLESRAEPYNAKIKVESTNAYNSPQYVDVSFMVTDDIPAAIALNTHNLEFSARRGGSIPEPKTFVIRNTGELTLEYILEMDVEWITVTPSLGRLDSGSITHTVLVNSSNLGLGEHEGRISVNAVGASNTPQNINVSLNITDEPPPTIGVQPGNLEFNAQTGVNPAAQIMQVLNSGEGKLNYQIDSSAHWLKVSPTTGSTKSKARNHTVSVSVQGLGDGRYTDTITVSDPSATNNPLTIPVELNITDVPPPPPPPPPSTDNHIWVSMTPSSGINGTVLTYKIGVRGNLNAIAAFGLDVTFDSTMFAFVGFSNGTLTSSWGAGVQANHVGGGLIKAGGWGGGNFVSVGSTGTLIEIRFRIIGSSTSNNICIGSFTDDINGLTPAPGCTGFTIQ